jgi:hypothetical protein
MAGVRFDFRSIGLVCLVPLMCGSASYAGVIRVPADRPTIQSAINAACPGDEIVVAPGRYVELINFAGKAVTVRSVAGPQSTIIDAGGRSASAVSFMSGESAASRLEGFTIVGVRGTPPSRGSAIRIAQASPTIADCIITQNVGVPAGGATVAGGSPSFVDVRFVSNIGIEAGGLSVVGGAIIDRGAFEFQPLARCRTDFNRDGFIDWFDAELFFERFEEASASADFDDDGFIDWFDLDAFLAAFDRGC